jgi:hypothetical protein
MHLRDPEDDRCVRFRATVTRECREHGIEQSELDEAVRTWVAVSEPRR